MYYLRNVKMSNENFKQNSYRDPDKGNSHRQGCTGKALHELEAKLNLQELAEIREVGT